MQFSIFPLLKNTLKRLKKNAKYAIIYNVDLF